MTGEEGARKAMLWIGMPIYNSRETAAKAVESLLSQTHRDFVLFISDNASTDGTSDILRSYADRDHRVRYVRQPVNRGAVWNFTYVLQMAESNYFMWAAGDDYWDPDFIHDNLGNLSRDPHAVLSVSRTAFINADGAMHPVIDTKPLARGVSENICNYAKNPASNSRFYGIHRRRIIQRSFRTGFGNFLASDWAVMVHSLQYGRHLEIDRLQLFRHVGGASANFSKLLKPYRRDYFGFFFPMARYSFSVLRVRAQYRSWCLIIVLAHLNLHFTLVQLVPALLGLKKSLRRCMAQVTKFTV